MNKEFNLNTDFFKYVQESDKEKIYGKVDKPKSKKSRNTFHSISGRHKVNENRRFKYVQTKKALEIENMKNINIKYDKYGKPYLQRYYSTNSGELKKLSKRNYRRFERKYLNEDEWELIHNYPKKSFEYLYQLK